MYEDLAQIAQLKFGKEIESISMQTREQVKEARNQYSALTGSSGIRSGPQEASIGRLQIEGAVRLVRALYGIWLDLIKERAGRISRSDIGFLTGTIDSYARLKKRHLHAVLRQQRGAVVNLLTQEADMQIDAVAADIRRELQIMVREYEAFPDRPAAERKHSMAQMPKSRFSPHRRVLVGKQSRPGTVISVDDQPGDMGEFRHKITLDRDGQTIDALGCDLQPFPELDEDLRNNRGTTFHGDQIVNYGPVGAVGRGAQGVVNINDRWTNIREEVNLRVLAAQLEQLRSEYRKTAVSREDDKQLALLAEAAEAAERGDEGGVVSWLSRVSKSVLGAAKDIGTDVAAKVIAELLKGP